MSITNETLITPMSTDGIAIDDVTVDSLKQALEELELRYLIFCEKHVLDDNLNADEQYDLSESQQRWIDNYLNKYTSLKIQLLTMSKDAKANVSKELSLEESSDDYASYEAALEQKSEALLAFQLMQ